ncbi:nlp-52 [Pristionchus pacificus]|uniref:Uncharacterized protein n=1 Tax=Pristionchus pacificus TaxID=54126 RepID=A0A454Y6X3_PRIPA|nr:nlp-52 [Pristionchus pacificus]|eukprot:PDM82070.1 hypothetical protein PRIPAC_36463 [Pristionchus pacificus]
MMLKSLCAFLLLLLCSAVLSAELTSSPDLDLDSMFFSPYRIGKRSNFYAMNKKFARTRPSITLADLLSRDFRK